MPKPKKSNRGSISQAMLDKATKQPAQLTREQFEHIERVFSDFDVTRRGLLASLARSVPELMEGLHEDRECAEALAAFVESGRDYEKRLHDMAQLMRTAATRIEVALCVREDGLELLEAAKSASARENGVRTHQ